MLRRFASAASSANKVLVINSGSSSLKFKLFDQSQNWSVAASGLVERIGETSGSVLNVTTGDGPKQSTTETIPDHNVAIEKVISVLTSRFSASLSQEVAAVGHRVVHGGDSFSKATVVTPEVEAAIQRVTPLAPLHNPANLAGITASRVTFPCPQVAVFDTAFHATMPPRAYTYALPRALAEQEGLRRYGFHGSSYKYLLERLSSHLEQPSTSTSAILCHLGAGASMACVKDGVCVDTTMGVTPLEGLVMASRSGDVDPAVVLYLLDNGKRSAADVDALLNKQSGLAGICGEKDIRSILQKMQQGDASAKLAFEVFIHRVRRYLGAYLVELGGKPDAIVFSAGIGENSAYVRSAILRGLEGVGIEVDEGKNAMLVGGLAGEFGAASGNTKLVVIPTDEELSIAKQAWDAVTDA